MVEVLGWVLVSLCMVWVDVVCNGEILFWVEYMFELECFFKGEDLLCLVMQMLGVLWCCVLFGSVWLVLVELDVYCVNLVFYVVMIVDCSLLDDYFCYVLGQFWIIVLLVIVIEVKDQIWVNDVLMIVQIQNDVLWVFEGVFWVLGYLKVVVMIIVNCMCVIGCVDVLLVLEVCVEEVLVLLSVVLVVVWIEWYV